MIKKNTGHKHLFENPFRFLFSLNGDFNKFSNYVHFVNEFYVSYTFDWNITQNLDKQNR